MICKIHGSDASNLALSLAKSITGALRVLPKIQGAKQTRIGPIRRKHDVLRHHTDQPNVLHTLYFDFQSEATHAVQLLLFQTHCQLRADAGKKRGYW